MHLEKGENLDRLDQEETVVNLDQVGLLDHKDLLGHKGHVVYQD